MIQLQNSHFTRPSTWISVVFERPQFRQCQFRTESFMNCPLSRRSPATDASRKGGAEPSEGSEVTRVSPRDPFCRPQEAGGGVVCGAGGGAPGGVAETGAGVPSTPRTRPAGVRSAATGVVSGVGGAGSAVVRSAGCSPVRRFEQPGARRQRAATTARIRRVHFIAPPPDNFCRLVLPAADPLWRGDFRHSPQVTVTQGGNGIRRHGTPFDVTCSQEECRHGSSGMGGSRRVPPFVFRKSLFRRPQPALRGRGSRVARLSR
jgi:hypothetical protein